MGGGMAGRHDDGEDNEASPCPGRRMGGDGMGGGMSHGGGMGMMNMMSMMGGGLEGHGMMNFSKGLDRADAMRMRGEMMRAIGDILIKYANKVQEPAAKP
ncbi:MAG: hypothetical protein EPN41_05795 [Candidimonas sp.]|nr:MAG: hypothetical protein EPN41_05795 [Candidimonas sp.]